MKKLALVITFISLFAFLTPISSVEAAASNKYSVATDISYDDQGNAYVTVVSTYTNNSRRPMPIRVNLKFDRISVDNISEFNAVRNECIKILTTDNRVKFACNKFSLGGQEIQIQPNTTKTFTHSFFVDKKFVNKDKKLKFEVIFKDEIQGNNDKSIFTKVDLVNAFSGHRTNLDKK